MLNVVLAPPAPPGLRHEWRRSGLITDYSLGHVLARAVRRWGDRPALIDLTDDGRTLSYAALGDEVERLTSFLRARGLNAGDVVLLQSPNCREAVVAWWAAWSAGCTCVPVVDIYRAHELRQIVGAVRPDVVMSIAEHRDHQHAELFDALLDEAGVVPKARIAIRGEHPGWTSFEQAVVQPAGRDGAPDPADPADPALVLFTSGTTAQAKGVVHSSQTIVAEGFQMLHAFGITWRDRCYMALPLSHVTGVDLGIIVPVLTGSAVVLSRIAGLAQSAAELVAHDATWTSGPPSQVPAIVEQYRLAGREHDVPLRIFATGGTTVHRSIVEQGEALGFDAMRCYGMTECATVTMPSGADSAHLRLATDGPVAVGCECEAVDPVTREPVAPGAEGELRVRGPERMLGYLDPRQSREQIDDQGWFYSGDLGRIDEGGCVHITGRIKDIINRGGEKFSAREIEEVLISHAGVEEVAVVPAPDDRFGEVPAAFVVRRAGRPAASADELAAHLLRRGVARQKTPAHWHWVDELPTTPSGKVKKYELRRLLDSTQPATNA